MSEPSAAEQLLQAIDGLYLLLKPDEGFTIIAATEEFLTTTHSDRSILGRSLFDVFPEDPLGSDADGSVTLLAALQQVIRTKSVQRLDAHRYDLSLPAAMGGGVEAHYWNIRNTPVLGADGEVEYIVNHVEEASAKHNRNAVKILDSITEGFFTLDRAWRFDYVNQEAHRILEQQVGQLAGRVLWEVYPGLEGTAFEDSYHRTMYGREKVSFVAFYPNQGRWYDVTTFPAPEGMSVYFRNVTEQKQIEAERERLRQESDRQRRIYETALNSTPDFVYVFGLDHRALYANDALKRTCGVEDVWGKHWRDLGFEKWHADLHDAELDRVIGTRAPIRGEIPFTGTNGTRMYDYIFSPVLDPKGEVVAVAGTTRDITERQAAEQAVRDHAVRLAEADKAKDEFLATLSHELRNPLAPLRTAIEILRRVGGADERTQRLQAMMDRQISYLVRLVDDLLEMSRISRGTLTLQRERVDLAGVVANAVETSDSLVKAAGHTLTVRGPAEPVTLEADPIRLSQIIANLLSNAAKYTEAGGQIEVSAHRKGNSALIAVRDNGIGISQTLKPRLFEMFSRGDRHNTRNQSGLGIGLALSRRLAEMHGGDISLISAGPGQGSEFTVRIPLALDSLEGSSEQLGLPAERSALGRDVDVLVVDDNRDAADSLAIALSDRGANVRVAYSGPEALQVLKAWVPAVVFLDIGMPEMNGYEVARAIRIRHSEAPPKIVALTGWGQENDRELARDAGFDHHLVKPADLDTVSRLLQMPS